MNTFARNKVLFIIFFVILVGGVGLSVYLSQQEQDIRQEAAGAPVYSPPANYATWSSSCIEEGAIVPGLRGCVTQRGFNGKAYGKIRNTTSNQTFTVGMASYKAYEPYPNPYPTCDPEDCPDQYEWIWTQEYFDGITASLGPGKTVYFEVNVPTCAWQTDIFKGNVLQNFSPPSNYYSGQNNFIDGWYDETLPQCVESTPTPTPTLPPSVTPTPTSTPTPSACPVPDEVLNIKVTCPNCPPEEAS